MSDNLIDFVEKRKEILEKKAVTYPDVYQLAPEDVQAFLRVINFLKSASSDNNVQISANEYSLSVKNKRMVFFFDEENEDDFEFEELYPDFTVTQSNEVTFDVEWDVMGFEKRHDLPEDHVLKTTSETFCEAFDTLVEVTDADEVDCEELEDAEID